MTLCLQNKCSPNWAKAPCWTPLQRRHTDYSELFIILPLLHFSCLCICTRILHFRIRFRGLSSHSLFAKTLMNCFNKRRIRDLNPWPSAWQADMLTNCTNTPMKRPDRSRTYINRTAAALPLSYRPLHKLSTCPSIKSVRSALLAFLGLWSASTV